MVKGGSRKGAGAPFTSIDLSEDTALSLRILALNRKGITNSLATPRQIAQQIVEEWIAAAYAEYDAEIRHAEELALLGEQEGICESSR